MTLIDTARDLTGLRTRAERAMLAPIGLMSPLWLAFGAAASAGAACWWMTRWTRPIKDEVQAVPASVPVREDDLTELSGIGPKVAKALAARGVTTIAQLAQWTQEDLVAFDADFGLKGNTVRAGIVEQAKRRTAA